MRLCSLMRFSSSQLVKAEYNSNIVFVNFENKIYSNYPVWEEAQTKELYLIPMPYGGCRSSMMDLIPAGGGELAVIGRLQR